MLGAAARPQCFPYQACQQLQRSTASRPSPARAAPKRRACLGMSSIQATGEESSQEPAYFWMPDDQPYGAFSHWFEAPMTDQAGNKYPTVEHFMMYHKAVLFKDAVTAQQILATQEPEEAKAAGRKVQGFSTEVWARHRDQIVYDGNLLKFASHSGLRSLLEGTNNRPLVEASPEDSLWGIGFDAENASQNKASWGQNLCGKAIEKVRGALRQ